METMTTTVKRGNGRNGRKLVQCPRCDGKGRMRAFAHIEGGVCFLCGGTGRADLTCFSKVWEFDGEDLLWDGSGIGIRGLCGKSRKELLDLARYMYLGGSPSKFVASTPWHFAHLGAFILATGDSAVEARAVTALEKLGGGVDTFRAVLEAIRPYVKECR